MKTFVQKCDQLTTTNKNKTGLQDVFSNSEAFISELLKMKNVPSVLQIYDGLTV